MTALLTVKKRRNNWYIEKHTKQGLIHIKRLSQKSAKSNPFSVYEDQNTNEYFTM